MYAAAPSAQFLPDVWGFGYFATLWASQEES